VNYKRKGKGMREIEENGWRRHERGIGQAKEERSEIKDERRREIYIEEEGMRMAERRGRGNSVSIYCKLGYFRPVLFSSFSLFDKTANISRLLSDPRYITTTS